MKRIIAIVVVSLLLFTTTAQAAITYGSDYYRKNLRYGMTGVVGRDPIYLNMQEIEALLEIDDSGPLGTGKVFYVDSNVSVEGTGESVLTAKDTLDEAVALCADNQGDYIVVLQGHEETISGTDGVDIDVAGVTVIGVGDGIDAPEFTFSATGSEFVIGAANVTVNNLRFIAGVSAVTMGISVEDAGDHFTLVNCVFPKPTDNSFEFVDAIDVASGVTYITVAGCNYQNDPAGAAPNHFIDLGNAALVGINIVGNVIYGDFAVSAIWSNDTDTEVYVVGNTISNITSGEHCIEFVTGAATGVCAYNNLFTDTEGSTLDPGSLACFENYTTTAVNASAQISIRPDSGINQLNTTTVTTIAAAVNALSGYGMIGLCETNTTNTEVLSGALGGYGDGVFSEGYSLVCIYDTGGSVGTLPYGEVRDVTDYSSATGLFTTAAWTAYLTAGDYVALVRTESLNEYVTTAAGSSAINVPVLYVDDGGSDGEGRSWQTAKITIAKAEAIAVAGQVIYVGASHNEAIGSLIIDVAGLTIIGMGEGDTRPILDFDTNADEITINAAGVTFKNFRLNPDATVTVAGIVLGANGDGCLIENVSFVDGGTGGDEFIDCIVYNTGTVGTTVRNCTYENSTGTAGDTKTFVNIDAATIANATIEGCTIFGDFAEAPIWWGAAVPTNLLVKGNVISNSNAAEACIEGSGNATGMCIGNMLYSDDITVALDPGYMKCYDNWAADAVDQQAVRVPLSGDSSDVAEDDDGSDLERIEYLQNKVDDILAGIRMAGGSVGDVYYCDENGSAGAGTTWATAVVTLDAAYSLCTTDVGDIVFVAPDHEEVLAAAQVACDLIGVSIIGIGVGDHQPEIEMQHANSSIDVTGAGTTIRNIKFLSTTAATAIGIDIQAADFTMEDCLFMDSATDFEFVIAIDVAAAAEMCTIRNCRFESVTGITGAASAINNTAGVVDRLIIEDCHIWGDFDNAGIYSTAISTNAYIAYNSITNNETTDHAIELTAAMTGDLVGNILSADTQGSVLDPGSMRCFENYVSSAINTSGQLSPANDDVMATYGTGRIIYVDSGTPAAGDGRSWGTAVATINAGIALCLDDRSDVIYVAAGHAEVMNAADEINITVDDVTIIGLGVGENRPTLTYSTNTAGELVIDTTADDVSIENIVFIANFPDLILAIDVETGAENVVIKNCLFTSSTPGTNEFDDAIIVRADSDDILIQDNQFYMGGGASEAAINIIGGSDHARIIGNEIFGDYAVACIEQSTPASIHILIKDNVLFNGTIGGGTGLGTTPGISLLGTTTGLIINNQIFCNVTTPNLSILADDCFLSGNTYSESESTGGSVGVAVNRPSTYATDTLGLLGSGSTGNIWYVDSGETTTTEDGLTWETATDTVEEAKDLCGSNTGDIILVAAGHAETGSTAGIDIDIPGITIIGLGNGDNRPTITYTTATDTVLFGADGDNSTIKNFRFVASVTAVATAIQVEAACLNWTIEGCEFSVDDDNVDEFIDTILASGGASHGGTIKDCKFLGTQETNTGFQAAINFADINDITIVGNEIYGDRALACIENSAAADRILIKDNILFNGIIGGEAGLNTVTCVTLHASTAGIIANNRVFCNLNTPDLAIVAADCFLSGNTYSEDEGGAATAIEVGTRPGQVYCVVNATVAADGGDVVIFTVAGGPIKVTSMHLVLTEVLDAACTVAFLCTPTNGSATAMSTGIELNGHNVGDMAYSTLDAGVTVIADIDGTAIPSVPDAFQIIPVGTVTLDMADASPTQGIVDIYMMYEVYVPGTTVVIN